ncbi:hypothetical protein PAPYR_1910 [Paratrimastix pyriformis]|uniref:Uncharacterized protein n=1 Tax=Paratrimastix pyriformis TaxID=342808 RepID=A0ABQ8URL2_9EUKA|nr:hypothetical protein PAPYR_1910 [Paratrimastix pyriformis]
MFLWLGGDSGRVLCRSNFGSISVFSSQVGKISSWPFKSSNSMGKIKHSKSTVAPAMPDSEVQVLTQQFAGITHSAAEKPAAEYLVTFWQRYAENYLNLYETCCNCPVMDIGSFKWPRLFVNLSGDAQESELTAQEYAEHVEDLVDYLRRHLPLMPDLAKDTELLSGLARKITRVVGHGISHMRADPPGQQAPQDRTSALTSYGAPTRAPSTPGVSEETEQRRHSVPPSEGRSCSRAAHVNILRRFCAGCVHLGLLKPHEIVWLNNL